MLTIPHAVYMQLVVVKIYSLSLPLSFQNLTVARNSPPTNASEDEDTENLAGDESDSEATEGGEANDGDNANEFVVEQRVQNVETLSDTESSPEAEHGLHADEASVPDVAPSTATPTLQKR